MFDFKIFLRNIFRVFFFLFEFGNYFIRNFFISYKLFILTSDTEKWIDFILHTSKYEISRKKYILLSFSVYSKILKGFLEVNKKKLLSKIKIIDVINFYKAIFIKFSLKNINIKIYFV